MRDNRLSRSECRALRECLREERPGFSELNILRARLFDLVSKKLNSQNYRELHEWLEEAVKLIMQPLKPGAREVVSKCYFNPGNSCRDAVIEQLRKARRIIRICVFTISDDAISREIVAAKRRGVAVEIITDNDKTEDLGSDIRALRNAGIAVYVDTTPNHMHHKFAVMDSEWLVSGSFNWTRSASLYNQENVLVTNDPRAVAAYEREFVRLIPQMASYTG